jgi:hypothetical protein
MKKSLNSKIIKLKQPFVCELPSSNVEMENFVQKNKSILMNCVADSIGYAIKKNLAGIEVFRFEKSDYIVIIPKKDYEENLDNIFECSMKDENYELCGKIKSIKKMLFFPKLTKKLKTNNLI